MLLLHDGKNLPELLLKLRRALLNLTSFVGSLNRLRESH